MDELSVSSGNAAAKKTGTIKIGAVSYLNTKPLIYGFENGMMAGETSLVFDFPSNIARQLLNNQVDIGLVPVAVLPLMPEYHIIADYCIGCDGAVASVCLFSDVPLHKIEKILLDYQSRTSVALLKILLKEHWNISPQLIPAEEGYQQQISGTTAGLVIGDRAFKQIPLSAYHYDLGLAWKEMTGLPFVFAAWVSNKPIATDFIAAFNKTTSFGLDHIDAIVKATDYKEADLDDYYKNKISFLLDEKKRTALQLFLSMLK